MYGEILGGHILLVCSWIEELFTLMILTFVKLHNDIQFVVTRCTQQKLFWENLGSDEHKQSIASYTHM